MKQQPKQVTDAFEDQPAPQEETSFGDILNQFEQEQSEHARARRARSDSAGNRCHRARRQRSRGYRPQNRRHCTYRTPSRRCRKYHRQTRRHNHGHDHRSKRRILHTLHCQSRAAKDWSGLQEAFAEGRIIGGRVIEVVKGGSASGRRLPRVHARFPQRRSRCARHGKAGRSGDSLQDHQTRR